MTLEGLGWSPREAELFEPHAGRGLRPARVAVGYGATFRVYFEDGEALADISGRLRHAARTRRDLPAVGDWVALRWTSPAAASRWRFPTRWPSSSRRHRRRERISSRTEIDAVKSTIAVRIGRGAGAAVMKAALRTKDAAELHLPRQHEQTVEH